MNKNENVSVIMKAQINESEMATLIANLGSQIANGSLEALPEDFADLFSVEIVTRPSGSRYVVIDFA